MPRLLLSLATLFVLTTLASPVVAAPTAAQRCEADVELASGKFAQCRLRAEAAFASTQDSIRRDAALGRCVGRLALAVARSVTKYGAANCTAATATEFDQYLSQCTDQVASASLAGGTLPRCGNGVIDVPGEQCDGADVGGDSCLRLGFAGGELGCDAECRLTTVGCVLPTPTPTPTPVPIVASTIAAGAAHTCALTSAGGVRCWGANGHGQLGNGTTMDSASPVDVPSLSAGVSAISAGGNHACVLTTGGAVKCWGANSNGQLGNGTITDSAIPVEVTGLSSGIAAVSAGFDHTCALTTGGGVKCWGYNGNAQLGNGTAIDSSTPVDVIGLSTGVAAISMGGNFSCSLTTGGGVQCWGGNFWGELGAGTETKTPPYGIATPVGAIGLGSGVVAITGGLVHACALTNAGGVKCWGYNQHGQLGNGSMNGSATPGDVNGLSTGVAAISAGGESACALTNGGFVRCWGQNDSGQLGDGTTTQSTTFVDVTGLGGVLAIAVGGSHSCALAVPAGAYCWGSNSAGQLGDGTTTNSSTPVGVSGLSG